MSTVLALGKRKPTMADELIEILTEAVDDIRRSNTRTL